MSVMLEVEAKLKAGGPVETIAAVLQGFKDAVNQEQVNHDDVYAAQKAECESEIAYRNTEVGDANDVLRNANKQIATATRLRNKAQAQLQAASDSLIQNRQHFTIINDVIRDETASYNKNAVSYNDAINAIDDAIDLAGKLAEGGSGSFLEVARTSGQFLKHAVTLKMVVEYRAVLSAFAQITQDDDEDVDVGAVERLIQLLNTLKQHIQDEWVSYGEEHNDSLASYNDQKDRISGNIARLEAQEHNLEEAIENYNNTIASQTALAQAASNKLQRNQALLDDAEELCEAVEEEYQAATAGRRNELVIIAELERLVERRAAEFAEGH
jgi:chromosome segregation ATPase